VVKDEHENLTDTSFYVQAQEKGHEMMQKPIWEQKRPKKLGESKPLSPDKEGDGKEDGKRED
jgi:hypothetical protein